MSADSLPKHQLTTDASLNKARILIEQLHLVLDNLRPGLIGSWVGAVLATIALEKTLGLWMWLGFYSLLCVDIIIFSKRHREIAVHELQHVARMLMLRQGLTGLAWGLLPWLAFNPQSVANSALILGMLAGIVGAAQPMLSSFRPCYYWFLAGAVLPLALILLLQNDLTFFILGVCSLIYAATMVYFSRNSENAALKAIELRFENADLVLRLQQEYAAAQAARDDAQTANMAKSKFLAAASHDLRQPIHAQSLFLEVLQRSGALNKRQQQALTSATAATHATRDMLNTLLDFSRIEAGVLQPQIRNFSLQAMLDKIKDEMLPQATSKGLIYRSRNTPHIVSSDSAMVELILRNLISNAIRYTDAGGLLVGCRLRQMASQLCVSVEVWDSGCGIAADNQREVFREFHQLGNPERDQHKGLGLGLAIAEGLAIGLSHRLSLSSRLGRGSVFSLSLPLAESGDELTGDENLAAEDKSFDKNDARLKNLRVLIIEDDKAVREAMVQLLQSWGCNCAAVEYIEEALIEAQSHQPQFIVSDYRLREHRTGREAIMALRAAMGEHIPALLITGDTAPERLREAQASGVPVLHKPVLPELLQQTMLKLLA